MDRSSNVLDGRIGMLVSQIRASPNQVAAKAIALKEVMVFEARNNITLYIHTYIHTYTRPSSPSRRDETAFVRTHVSPAVARLRGLAYAINRLSLAMIVKSAQLSQNIPSLQQVLAKSYLDTFASYDLPLEDAMRCPLQ